MIRRKLFRVQEHVLDRGKTLAQTGKWREECHVTVRRLVPGILTDINDKRLKSGKKTKTTPDDNMPRAGPRVNAPEQRPATHCQMKEVRCFNDNIQMILHAGWVPATPGNISCGG